MRPAVEMPATLQDGWAERSGLRPASGSLRANSWGETSRTCILEFSGNSRVTGPSPTSEGDAPNACAAVRGHAAPRTPMYMQSRPAPRWLTLGCLFFFATSAQAEPAADADGPPAGTGPEHLRRGRRGAMGARHQHEWLLGSGTLPAHPQPARADPAGQRLQGTGQARRPPHGR